MGGVFVPTTGIDITGDYNRSQDIGGTGSPLESYTCKKCGSVFAVYSHAVPLMTIITANSLDDQSKFQPIFHHWVGEKPHWVSIADDLPQFERSVDWEQLGGRPNFGTPPVSTGNPPD